jgi:hypothetical protein
MMESYERDLAAFEKRMNRDDWAAELEKIQPEVSGYARRYLGQ